MGKITVASSIRYTSMFFKFLSQSNNIREQFKIPRRRRWSKRHSESDFKFIVSLRHALPLFSFLILWLTTSSYALNVPGPQILGTVQIKSEQEKMII